MVLLRRQSSFLLYSRVFESNAVATSTRTAGSIHAYIYTYLWKQQLTKRNQNWSRVKTCQNCLQDFRGYEGRMEGNSEECDLRGFLKELEQSDQIQMWKILSFGYTSLRIESQCEMISRYLKFQSSQRGLQDMSHASHARCINTSPAVPICWQLQQLSQLLFRSHQQVLASLDVTCTKSSCLKRETSTGPLYHSVVLVSPKLPKLAISYEKKI